MNKFLSLCAALIALAAIPARAQSVFTPATVEYTPGYWTALLNTMAGNSRTCYICAPSFLREYALSLHGDTLVYTRVDDKASVYYYVCAKKHREKVKTQRYEMVLSRDESLLFKRLIGAATETANFFDEHYGIDGTIYYLFDGLRRVKVWSPWEGNRTYRTVAAMDSLCYAVEHADREVLQRQLAACHSLTEEFRELYPLSYFIPDVWSSSERILLTSRRWLSVCQGCRNAQDSVESSLTKLSDSVAHWSRELFLHYYDRSVSVFLSDTSGARCEVKESGREIIIIIPPNKLCRNLIISTTSLAAGHYSLSPDGTWQPIRRENYQWWPTWFDKF
ncbi:MAG: hypothetical protein J6X62_01220 [Bacteroidales bacterium]|nr:hypothetical protein [Bacteroidales bacterium]